MVEVKQSAEEKHTNSIQMKLKGAVFSDGCSNWYIGKHGRNSASWPAKAASLWYETYFPDWGSFTGPVAFLTGHYIGSEGRSR